MASDDFESWGKVSPRLNLLFCEAVYFGPNPQPGKVGPVSNGTITFLKMNEDLLVGVTCKHVLDSYRQRSANAEDIVFQLGPMVIDPIELIIDESEEFDLVSLDLGCLVSADRFLTRHRFKDIFGWPPAGVEPGDFVSLAGFPGERRRLEEPRTVNFGTFSMVGSKVESVEASYFYSRIEAEKCRDFSNPEYTMPGLGGLSGGPVFANRPLCLELVGFVQEYSAPLDLLRCRMASVMSIDGHFYSPRDVEERNSTGE